MTGEEMCDFVAVLVDEPRFDGLIPAYVEMAKSVVVGHLYPFREDATWQDVPERHHARTCEIAVYLVNRRGAEGETAHSENGVSRSYESAGIPASFFDGMPSFAGVPS